VRVALEAVRAHEAAAVVVAAPAAPAQVVEQLAALADRVIVLIAARSFASVGSFYRDFSQLSDADVQAVLRARD
jgi:putative phosphoribosyl transferase